MRNGSYSVTLRGTHIDTTVTVRNGTYTLSNGRQISEKIFKDYYVVGDKIKQSPAKYDIAWIVNGRIKEMIPVNGAYGLCKSKITQIKRNYSFGELKPIKHNTDARKTRNS